MLDNFREIYNRELEQSESHLEKLILSSEDVRMFVYEICKACVTASHPGVTPDACNCGSKKPSEIYMPVQGFICPDCKMRR